MEVKFSKTKAVFFLMNSLCALKANGAFSAKSWPGTLWKLKIGHFEPANHHSEGRMKHFEAKRIHFQARMMYFEAKMMHFEAKIVHFAVENGHFEAV